MTDIYLKSARVCALAKLTAAEGLPTRSLADNYKHLIIFNLLLCRRWRTSLVWLLILA